MKRLQQSIRHNAMHKFFKDCEKYRSLQIREFNMKKRALYALLEGVNKAGVYWLS